MTYGICCRANDGTITATYTDRLSRELGSFQTGTSSGSLAIPVTSSTAQCWIFVRDISPFTLGSAGPIVTVSGNVVTWDFSHIAVGINPRSVTVFYGEY
ncbi:hypothetical protein [Pararobbsia silviterrae]|uniref:Uncharacterized protein n=1 Tax=Pararobbsia silviterrae TaxID=1792498 RepID=A0A494X0C6_9BURK|nr:hypothetical protein [Pararobbsia silviterrae]RKP43790.1 hypothetical protein D7S86_28380 [Pararobbsia silviterrae]